MQEKRSKVFLKEYFTLFPFRISNLHRASFALFRILSGRRIKNNVVYYHLINADR
ncbi:MAG: hypothetical protein ACTSPW_13235 [Promethearchaeota archaeon]